MYLEHFGLAELPFRITPHTDFFFAGANRGATLEALLYAITHDEGIIKVSGEVGSGKTMLCRVLMERLPANVISIPLANPLLSRDEIVETIATDLAIDLSNTRPGAILRALQERLIALYGEGRQVVVMVDEAHAMPGDTLEQIRLLSNLESGRHKLLHIALFGQPELDETLMRAGMRQLKDRITHHFRLDPLGESEVSAYVEFRLRAAGYKGPPLFSRAALGLLARASAGLTRRINILADKCLLAVFAEGSHQVLPQHVRSAIRDSELPGGTRHQRKVPTRALAGGALLCVAAAAFWAGQRWQSTARPAAVAASAALAAPAPLSAPSSDTPPTPVPPVQKGTDNVAIVRPELTAAGQRWIEATPGERWSLLLLTSEGDGDAFVESFIQRAARQVGAEAIHTVGGTSAQGRRIMVAYGDFASQAEARNALAQLPPALRAYGAYPRQIRQLR